MPDERQVLIFAGLVFITIVILILVHNILF